jgi:ribosomal protein S18 acetylase RimI-like enzyme
MLTQVSDETLSLRPARADDESFLLAVYASTRADELALVGWSEAKQQAFVRAQFDAQAASYQQNYPGAQFSLILVAGEPAGRLYLHRRPAEIRIMDLALLPPFRGQGHGTRLLRQVLDEGRARGLPVTIHVERFNPALRLYQRLGFREVQDKGVYAFLEWTPEAGPDAG